MKVVIFCGGEGTRLREETEFKPKPLVEIGGMPILWHIMKIYSHYGHKEFILPLGYKGEMIKDFFVNFNWKSNDFTLDFRSGDRRIHVNHILENWKLHLIETGLKSMTTLRLHKVKHLLENDDNFMVTYGDGIADININKLIEFHEKQKKIVTITGVKVGSKFGIVEVDENGIANTFKEKPKNSDMVNGGFMVFNKKIFNYINGENTMLVSSVLPKLAEKGEVAVYKHDGSWFCMDTYRDYLELNKMWEENPKWKIWK